MGKIVISVLLIVADTYMFNGWYTDAPLSMLEDMRRSFGF